MQKKTIPVLSRLNRLYAKLAYAVEFVGDTERKNPSVRAVREDLSTGSTSKLPAEVEFCKKTNKNWVCHIAIWTAAWLPMARAHDTVLLDKVVATVNEEVIFHSDLEEACNQYALEGKTVDAALKMSLLRDLVLRKLFLAKAKLHDVTVPKAAIQKECDAQIARLIQRFGSQAKLVEVAHQPIYQIKKALKSRSKADYLESWVHKHLTQDVVVTPKAVKTYFNALPLSQRPYCPAAVQVHQLVAYPKISAARQTAVKNKLLEIKRLIVNGEVSFAESAKQHSADSYSAAQGGEIGWVPLGLLDPAYESTALALKIGEISAPVASPFGWHLIELIGRNKEQYNTRHILQVIEPTEEEIRLAEDGLNKIRSKVVTGKLTFEAAAKKYSEDQKTASQGGVITYNQRGESLPSVLIPVESLDPDIYFAIDKLEVGGVSGPQPMGSACRLLYLKNKVEAHPMNLVQDYEKIYHYLLQQKKKEAIDKWIQTTKSTFVIRFAPEYESVEKLL